MINLSEKIGEMTFDGLITDIKPAPEVRSSAEPSWPSPPAPAATASW